jgi:hypothetical protein
LNLIIQSAVASLSHQPDILECSNPLQRFFFFLSYFPRHFFPVASGSGI